MKKSIKRPRKTKIIDMKSFRWLLLCTLIIYFSGSVQCQNNKELCTNVSPRYSTKECYIFKDSAVIEGNYGAFMQLYYTQPSDFPKFQDGEKNYYELLIPYALIMANRYEHPRACFDIYMLTTRFYEHYGLDMDNETQKFLLMYLEKGAKLGNLNCIKTLESFKKEEAINTTDNPNNKSTTF